MAQLVAVDLHVLNIPFDLLLLRLRLAGKLLSSYRVEQLQLVRFIRLLGQLLQIFRDLLKPEPRLLQRLLKILVQLGHVLLQFVDLRLDATVCFADDRNLLLFSLQQAPVRAFFLLKDADGCP
ncbi:hypothetical protein D3C71_1654420 [compost metagenome]